MRNWRSPLVAMTAVTVGALAFFVATAGASSAKTHAKPAIMKIPKTSAAKQPAAKKQSAHKKAPNRPHLAMTKSRSLAKAHRHPTRKVCEMGQGCVRVHCYRGTDDCRKVHCRGNNDDCTHAYCEHGSDDCTSVPCERGDGCVPATCAAGDDCQAAPTRTCSEQGDDCQPATAEQPTSQETEGQLPFTGGNILGIGGLGLLLSGGGLLLARRLRRDQT